MEIDLSAKTALVTGASSGLGAGVAHALAAAGASVHLVGRDLTRLDSVRAQTSATGADVSVSVADLRELAAVDTVLDDVDEAHGGLDVLVCAAGLFEVGAQDEVNALDRQWEVNVRAPFALAYRALPRMRKGGAICLFSSIAGQVGFPGAAAYVTTKWAVEGAVRALALDAAELGIRVNAIAPGNIRTPMNEALMADPDYEAAMLEQTPMGRIGEVPDVVPGVVFLVSDLAGYIHGTSLTIDGGWTAK